MSDKPLKVKDVAEAERGASAEADMDEALASAEEVPGDLMVLAGRDGGPYAAVGWIDYPAQLQSAAAEFVRQQIEAGRDEAQVLSLGFMAVQVLGRVRLRKAYVTEDER